VSKVTLAARGLGVAAKEATRAALDRAVPTGGQVPLRLAGVTPRWLEGRLDLQPGAIRAVRVLDEHSGTAARARIGLDAAPGAEGVPTSLFVKFTPRNYLQHVMMLLFDLGTVEVLFYDTLGANFPVRIPHCHAAEVDTVRGRSLMVFEDLSPTARFRDIREPATPAEAEAVIDAMAVQHATFWRTDRFAGDLQGLTGRSAAANLLGDVIRRRFIGGMKGVAAGIVPSDMRHHARILFERSADIDAMWASQPQTVIHGDPHLGNLFFEGDTPGFLDWQVATAGAGIRDVTYFATMSVEPDVLRKIERGLVERYVSQLGRAGIDLDPAQQWTLYRAGATEPFLSAVAAAEAGERAQPPAVTRVGVERSVAACAAHDSFAVLRALVDGDRGAVAT
jgi:hypothetical protein